MQMGSGDQRHQLLEVLEVLEVLGGLQQVELYQALQGHQEVLEKPSLALVRLLELKRRLVELVRALREPTTRILELARLPLVPERPLERTRLLLELVRQLQEALAKLLLEMEKRLLAPERQRRELERLLVRVKASALASQLQELEAAAQVHLRRARVVPRPDVIVLVETDIEMGGGNICCIFMN